MPHRLRPIALALFAVVGLGACSAPAPAPIPQEGVIRNEGSNKQDLAGRLLKPQGDPTKAEVVLNDEYGKAVPDVKPAKPNGTGAFIFPSVVTSTYFAVATFEDKSTQEGLMSSQTYYNPVSPATSLTAAYARNLLDAKLIFVEDLPLLPLSGVTFELDTLVADRKLTLEAAQAGRLNQFNQLKTATPRLVQLTQDIEETIDAKAAANLKQKPPYASQAEYDDKKKKLGL